MPAIYEIALGPRSWRTPFRPIHGVAQWAPRDTVSRPDPNWIEHETADAYYDSALELGIVDSAVKVDLDCLNLPEVDEVAASDWLS